jgi:hypothetical protein
MKIQYGDFTISYIDGVTYHNYIFSKAECYKNGKEYNQLNNPRAEYLFGLDFTDQKKVALEDAKFQMKSNFSNVIRAYFDNLLENSKTGNGCISDLKNYKNRNDFTIWKSLMFDITKWQNRFFSLMAILLSAFFLLKYYKRERLYFFIAFFITYIIVLSGISCGQGDRFHLVTFPFMILLLAKFLSDKNWIKPFSEQPQK